MMRFRPYKSCDAEKIVGWLKDEYGFRQWSADRFGKFPLTADELTTHYAGQAYNDGFFEFTACDEKGVCGHMIIRFTDEEKKIARFGFVIVDSERRGEGLGRKMLELAKEYTRDFLEAEKITLGVFENNPAALNCYLAAGFRVVGTDVGFYSYHGEDWKCIEMECIL